MSETEVATAPAPAATTPKKTSKAKSSSAGGKKTKAKPTHPKTSDMVTAAIKNLKERGGSSLQAIKKYIGANYKVDAEKLAPFIRKYLKSAVTSGSLVQTKGKGASGSFKLPTKAKSAVKKENVKPSVTASKSGELKAKKAKVAAAVKKTPVKKSASSVPKKAPSKEKTSSKTSVSSKSKKVKKAPTKKPKAPKPKKVGQTTKAKTAAKKSTPSKKK